MFARPGLCGMGIGRLGLVAASRNAFSPLSLFSASEPGAWYDPSDMSTLFQDSAGTTPVTAVEQPVGLILDKSGRGNHAIQATTTKRPVLKIDAVGCYYLSFDGVDDALQTGNIDFTGTDKMTVWAGVTRLGGDTGVIVELGDGHNTNSILLYGSSDFYDFYSRGSFTSAATAANRPIAITEVLAAASDVSNDVCLIRLDGNQKSLSDADQGAGGYRDAPLYIGARSGTGLYFNGRLYSLTVRGAQSSLSQIEATELYIKQKMRLP